MRSLWHNIYQVSGGGRQHRDARRIANLSLALHLRWAGAGLDESFFFKKVVAAAKQLGNPIPLDAGLAAEIWSRLQDTHVAAPTNAKIDDWVEAFQGVDKARKSLGAFATPAPFSDVLASETLGPLIASKATPLRIVDPSAGAGSLLLAAHRCLVAAGYDAAESVRYLHGVELDPDARELCVLLLWTAAGPMGPDLSEVSKNIHLANAITFDWLGVEPFDALLMNPPWESLRQGRSDAVQAKIRTETLERIDRPQEGARGLPPLFSAQGRGDRNLFKLFVELAPHLLREGGRCGALLPAAFGSDDGMSSLRQLYFSHFALERWTSFENRAKYFQIDTRYKFGLLTGTRSREGTSALDVLSFCMHPRDARAPHIRLDRTELRALGGKDHMIPELVNSVERDVLTRMLTVGTPLFERGPVGSVQYRREMDLTLGRRAGQFWHVEESGGFGRRGEFHFGDNTEIVPVLEGRMIGQFDCFQKSWVSGGGRRAVWEANGSRPLKECRPQYVTHSRGVNNARVAICDVTSATNTRTVLAALVPPTWVCGNTAPVLAFENEQRALAGLAILNSMVFDWFARRTVGGLHLNRFYLARLTWPRLTGEEVMRLAELARGIAGALPRAGFPTSPPSLSVDTVALHAEVEILVAKGYGLDAVAIETIFADDRADRRGLWRYFASNPVGRDVARRTMAHVDHTPEPRDTLAA